MTKAFDPYHKWLGIAPKDQPPNHYRLLGMEPFESDADVITSAADMRMTHIRSFQSGQRSTPSQKLLNEIAAARVCLLDPQKKAEYDAHLQQQLPPEVRPPRHISPDQIETEAHRAGPPSISSVHIETNTDRPLLRPPLPGRTKRETGASTVRLREHGMGTEKPARRLVALLGTVGSAPLRWLRAVDNSLCFAAGTRNSLLHNLLRIASIAAVLAVVGTGFSIWLGGQSDAELSGGRSAGMEALPGLHVQDTNARAADGTSQEIALPPCSGKGTLVSIGPRTYEVQEVRVNDHTRQKQHNPSLAVLTNNTFLVGWESCYQLRSTDCYGKVFSATGTAIGKEFLLNPHNSSGWEYGPALAAQASGGFVVAWGDTSRDTCLQRFDGTLNPIGNDWVPMPSSWPTVSSAPNGDFVVVGTTRRNRIHAISARRYSWQGNPLGDTWQVNNESLGFTEENISGATIAHASDGSFTIAWYNAAGDILARRFYASGAARGPEFVVNSSTGGHRMDPALAYDNKDECLIAWYDFGDGRGHSIRARRFRADGSPEGEEWTIAPDAANCPNVAVGPTNEFVVDWRSHGGVDTYARIYDAAGQPVGNSFRVNQHTPGQQWTPFRAGKKGVAIIGNMLVFTWYGNTPGDDEGIGLTTFRRVSPGPAAEQPLSFATQPSDPPPTRTDSRPTTSARDWRTDYPTFLAKLQEIIKQHAPTSPPTQDSALVTFFALETETDMMYILYHGIKLAKVYEEIEDAFGGKSIRWQGTVEEIEDESGGKTVTVRLCEKKPTAHGWSFPSTFDVFVPASEFARLPAQLKGKRVELSGSIPSKPDIDGENVMSGLVLMYGVGQYAGEKMVLVSLNAKSIKPVP